MKRWGVLVAAVVMCWAGAMACKGSGVPAEAPQGPGTGESAMLPKSLFIPVRAGQEKQIYRVDIAPVENPEAASETTKGSKITAISPKPKHRGYQAKSQVAHHLKFSSPFQETIGITPFNELVVYCDSTKIADAPSGCMANQVRLIGKDSTVDILKNRKLSGFIGPHYDEVGDRLLFVVTDENDTGHLMQRTMDGKESELYQDKKLLMIPIFQNAYLIGEKGLFVMTLANGKMTKLSDSNVFSGIEVTDRNGGYFLLRKKDQSLLIKSDGSKSYDLPPNASGRYYNADLNEILFVADQSEASPAAKSSPAKTSTLYRLDLQTEAVTALSKNSDIIGVLDHVGDQYLVATLKTSPQYQKAVQLSWLRPDGSLQDIVSVETWPAMKMISYNPQHQVVAIHDGNERLHLVSAKEGKVVVTLDNTEARPAFIFSSVTEMPIFLTFQKTDTPGAFNVGLISPDMLGGVDGKDFGLVSLGTIDTKQPNPSVGHLIFSTDIHDTKARTPVAVADNTPPPKPEPCVAKCDGKQCGDDGCGGSCGDCGAEKICSTENKCVEKTKTTTITATNFQAAGELVVTNGTMQTATGEAPKVVVKGEAPPKSVYVICGSNVPPYQIQKFVLSADPNDPTSYVLAVSDIKPEILASPKFACTTTVLDADGNFQFLKLKVVIK